MQIKVTQKLQIALIYIWHTTPKGWPCFISTDDTQKQSSPFKSHTDHFFDRLCNFLQLYHSPT